MAQVTDGISLKALIARGIDAGADFPTLCRNADGASPISIASALSTLNGSIALRERAMQLSADVATDFDQRPELDRRLPVPHPLDFDWRFSSATAEDLAARVTRSAGEFGRILLVGVPTVLLALCDAETRADIIFASRREDPVTQALRRIAPSTVKFVSIGDDLSDIAADASLVDPPWYDDIATPMILAAAQGTDVGGTIHVAAPDRLTGLSAAPLLTKLPTSSAQFGLLDAEPSVQLRYDMPPFERLALGRVGINNVPPTWRTGRLFRCRRIDDLVRPVAIPDYGWTEVGTAEARVWLRPRDKSRPFRLETSTSISRLDPERVSASVWTSGHRFSRGDLDVETDLGERRLREICDFEAAALLDQVVWRGRVQKFAGALPHTAI
jgi:hypothetical protein